MKPLILRLEHLKALVSPLSAFFLGTALTCCAYALLTSYLSLKMAQNGISTGTAGLVLSAYYAGYVLAALSAYHIINKAGHIRAFSSYISIFSALVLMHFYSQNPLFWAILRLFEGYCLGSAMMCLESWLNTRANNDNRGTIMSLYMITTYLGSSLGQLLLNIPTQNGVTIYVTVSVLFSIALVPVSLTALPTPDITVYRSMSLSRLYKVSPEGVVGCVVSGIFVGIFYTLGPIYTANNGLSVEQTSLFMFFGVLGGMFAQLPVGRLSDRTDRRFVMLWICGVLFLTAPWTQYFIHEGHTAVAVSAFVLGCGTFVLYPICVSHVNDKIADAERVRASGLLILLQSLGMIGGPVLISMLMQHFGDLSFVLAYSVFAGLFILFALHFITFHPRVNYINVTPTDPMPTAPTHVFHELAHNDTLLDKAKELFQIKKH